jgi:YVTN family beta-propeller protein
MVNTKESRGRKPREPAAYFLCLMPLLSSVFCIAPACATKVPQNLKNGIQKDFPGVKFRLDGSFETTHGELFIPIIPAKTTKASKSEIGLEAALPSRQEPNFLVFDNAWCFVRMVSHGRYRSIKLPSDMTENFRKFVLSGKLAPDLIVPEHFILPKSLQPILGDLDIQLVEDEQIVRPDAGSAPVKKPPKVIPTGGCIFVLSPSTGKISMLDAKTLDKVTEFSTEGTPSAIAYAQGKLYIADQSKNRILKLDPKTRQFIGQIELPFHSSPKGMAALPSGKQLYVAESGTNNVSIVDTIGDKVLNRIKVTVGPARVAVTPNGSQVLVLNTPAGKMSFISALTQKLLGVMTLGTLPNAIIVSSDSQKGYVSNRLSNTVSVIDLLRRSVIETLKTGNGPTGLALNDDESKLFVANAKDNTISVFDLDEHRKLDDIKMPLDVDFPGSLMLLPDRQHILVSSESTDAVGLVDATKMVFDKQPVVGHSSDEFLWVPLD